MQGGKGRMDLRGIIMCWQEREAEYEAEQQRIKKEKEKEVAELRALQERERDHQAEQVTPIPHEAEPKYRNENQAKQ